jgi:general secretion pathway protein B
MSYLLDALRKSEAERDRSATPDLNTQHRPAAPARRPSRAPLLVAVALAANAAVLTFWMLGRAPADPPVATGTADGATAGGSAVVNGPVERDPVGRDPAERDAIERDPTRRAPAAAAPVAEPADDAVAGASSTPPAPPPVVAVRDLPAAMQARIPPLAFSTHIYADEPRWREVGINGRRYAEGATVEGMTLVEITASGVVLELDGRRFAVSVLEDWDY